MQINVDWKGNLEFESKLPSGHNLTTDGGEESGGHNQGPRPMELLLSGLAGCTGLDVALILEKMQVELEDFKLEINAQRAEEYPQRFEKIQILYKFKGRDIAENSVKRAIRLSEEKYCSASSSLNAEITSSYEIENID